MRIHKRIKNLTEPEKEQFEEYLGKKVERISPMIKAHYPDPDTAVLDVFIEKISKRTVFKFSYTLDLPRTRPIAARGAKHTVTECMDMATAKLERGLTKHFKVLT